MKKLILLFIAAVLVKDTTSFFLTCVFINPCKHICHSHIVIGFVCSCRPGYIVDPTNSNNCIDIPAVCPAGLENNPLNTKVCQDIDECDRFRPCDHNCRNIEGSYVCSCREGFSISLENSNRCVLKAPTCRPGFQTNPLYPNTCTDIDECLRPNQCHQVCVNTEGGYKCGCSAGFKISPEDNTRCIPRGPVCKLGFQPDPRNPDSCIDVDECKNNVCDQICTNLQGGYRCSCRENFQVNSLDNSRCSDIKLCTTTSDIIFLLDSSGSMGEENNALQLSFASKIAAHFVIGTSNSRFGAVLFSDIPEKIFDLNRYSNSKDLTKALTSADYHKGTTYTNKGLDFIRQKGMFSASSGGRPNAQDIVIVFTDGRSNLPDQTTVAADNLKRQGVKIISVGIGDDLYLSELKAIASTRENVFVAPSFDMLSIVEQDLASRICQG
uniref:VWFA domain-containing protein n=1 Tax=Arion vulgaris TaxID=1028688 RepID=A0A0B6XY64_9EUPU